MKRRPARIALGALALLAAGCAVDHAREVAEYRAVLDHDAPAPGPAAACLPGQPLPLALALALANQHNEQLALSGEDFLQALIAKKRIVADFLPTVSLVPSFFLREPAGDNGFGAFSGDHHADLPVQGGFGPLNAVRSLENLRGNDMTIEQRRQLLLDARASLLLEVATTYYQVLRSERQVEVLVDSLAVQDERVRDVAAQKDAGTARPLDLAQAKAQAASTRAALSQARGDVRNGRTALAFVVGLPEVAGPLQDAFELPEDVEDRDALEARALQRRRDLKAARAAVGAARHGVEAAFAQHFPTVSLNLDYFVYRESLPEASIAAAFLQINLPIFRGGRIHADVRAAWSFFRQAKERESLALRLVRRDVRVAWQDLATSQGRLADLRTNVAAAQEAVDQATDLVRFGRATNLERLVAQDQLLTAQLALANEQFNRKVAYLRLRRATDDLTPRLDSIEPRRGDAPAP